MTRKDYVKIAGVFKDVIDEHMPESEGHVTISTLAEDLADVLQIDNPRFNRYTFLKACGVDSE